MRALNSYQWPKWLMKFLTYFDPWSWHHTCNSLQAAHHIVRVLNSVSAILNATQNVSSVAFDTFHSKMHQECVRAMPFYLIGKKRYNFSCWFIRACYTEIIISVYLKSIDSISRWKCIANVTFIWQIMHL